MAGVHHPAFLKVRSFSGRYTIAPICYTLLPQWARTQKTLENIEYLKMTSKSTSGCGFHFRFVLLAADLVENAINIDIDWYLESKVQKNLKWVLKTLILATFDILRPIVIFYHCAKFRSNRWNFFEVKRPCDFLNLSRFRARFWSSFGAVWGLICHEFNVVCSSNSHC